MTNQNTNNDILWIFEENYHWDDMLQNIDFEHQESSNDILSNFILSEENISTEIQEDTFQNTFSWNTYDILSTEISQNIQTTNENEIFPNYESLSKEKTIPVVSRNKFFSGCIFFMKYIATSSFIFAVLIASTNYSAYIEIARSYLNPEALEQNKQAMLTSVQDAKIIKDIPKQDISESEEIISQDVGNEAEELNTTEKIGMVKNKTYHTMEKLITGNPNKFNTNIEIVPYENRVVIPKIWKNIPLIDVQNKTVENVKELENIFMTELVNGIVRYPGSARPWEVGNSFIFWHSSNFPWLEWKYNDVFALIDNLTFWDEVITYYWQKKYTYKIKEKKIIKPGDVSVLKRENNISEITLMTCWPVGTTLNRMVVIWELIKEE